MLSFTRIDHLGQVVNDLDAQASLLEGLFGFRRVNEWEDANDGVRGVRFAVPGRSGIDWEVLAPVRDGSAYAAFLESARGPGLHHIALAVDDLAEVSGEVEALGAAAETREDRVDASLVPSGAREGLVFRFLVAPNGASRERAAGTADATTLGLIGIDHVCHAYRDRDELARHYERALGMRERWRTPDGEHEDLADLVMDVPGGQMSWEVIQPVGSESFITRFLETRGPAPHHVTFQVADWPAALAACEQHGVPVFDENAGETDGATWQDAFIHPRHTGGMLVQLFWEETPGVWVRSDKVASDR